MLTRSFPSSSFLLGTLQQNRLRRGTCRELSSIQIKDCSAQYAFVSGTERFMGSPRMNPSVVWLDIYQSKTTVTQRQYGKAYLFFVFNLYCYSKTESIFHFVISVPTASKRATKFRTSLTGAPVITIIELAQEKPPLLQDIVVTKQQKQVNHSSTSCWQCGPGRSVACGGCTRWHAP
jgi:hypothetical protein